jgi:hypothetical protein
MTKTSQEFWISRLSEALDKALAAPSERSRLAYLELARHYCSMRELSRTPGRRASVPRHDPTASAAADVGKHDFRSIHDALMQTQ